MRLSFYARRPRRKKVTIKLRGKKRTFKAIKRNKFKKIKDKR